MAKVSVYFDANVYDHCVDNNISAASLKSLLSSQGHELVLSSLQLLQIARCFEKQTNAMRGTRLAQYVLELLPAKVVLDMPGLLSREVRVACCHTPQRIFHDGKARAAFEKRLREFASGILPNKARKFVHQFISSRSTGSRQFIQACRSGRLGRLAKADTKGTTFSAFRRHHTVEYADARSHWTQCALRAYIHDPSTEQQRIDELVAEILGRPVNYPAFDAEMNIEMYLHWKTARDTTFRDEFSTDLRHLANAAYQDIFVTRDGQLLKTGREIFPKRDIQEAGAYLSAATHS